MTRSDQKRFLLGYYPLEENHLKKLSEPRNTLDIETKKVDYQHYISEILNSFGVIKPITRSTDLWSIRVVIISVCCVAI